MLRFASSSTADMHIGNLRVALFNYIIAKQRKEDLIVRIEDTDKERNLEGKDTETLDILDVFGISYSQVIYQSENVRFHTAMALQLMHEKKSFSCFCSDIWLDKKSKEAKSNNKIYKYDDACANLPAELVIDNTNPFTIRIAKPTEKIVSTDKIKGKITFEANDIDSFIILKQDKTPTSNFACAVDDMLNDISIVIRDEEHIKNTPKQEHIRKALHYEKKIEYAHLPTISNNDTFSVKWLLEEGFLPEAIINYLLSIGNQFEQEIFTLEESIKYLDLAKMSSAPVAFDINKLRYINNKHLSLMSDKELSRYVGFADEEIGKLAKVYLEEVSTTKELKAKISTIFTKKAILEEFRREITLLVETIKLAPYFESYDDFRNYLIKKTNLEDEKLLKPLRYVLTGSIIGPDIVKIYNSIKNYIGEIVK